jgi:prepilin-type N-terminal cleavage/methylation domain-containing protein
MAKQSVIRYIVPSLHRTYGSTIQRFNDSTRRSYSSFSVRSAFTLIELVVVIAIIVILVGLVLSTVGYVQKKAARSRAETEIAAMSAALESYKADNGVYPSNATAPGAHALYQGLSGDGNNAIGGTNASTGTPGSSGKSYMPLKPNMLRPNPPDATTRVIDPFANDYNYMAPGTTNAATFDLWSTANSTDPIQWIKNW